MCVCSKLLSVYAYLIPGNINYYCCKLYNSNDNKKKNTVLCVISPLQCL